MNHQWIGLFCLAGRCPDHKPSHGAGNKSPHHTDGGMGQTRWSVHTIELPTFGRQQRHFALKTSSLHRYKNQNVTSFSSDHCLVVRALYKSEHHRLCSFFQAAQPLEGPLQATSYLNTVPPPFCNPRFLSNQLNHSFSQPTSTLTQQQFQQSSTSFLLTRYPNI
jgi:hypothetical protein